MSNADVEEPISIRIAVKPRQGLPVNVWDIDIPGGQTVLDVKTAVESKYSVMPQLQRLCKDDDFAESGFKDAVLVTDLPDHPETIGAKFVYLLPRQGKDKELLDLVLAWAFNDGVLEEYEAKGCVYEPPADADIRRQSSRVSIKSAGVGLPKLNFFDGLRTRLNSRRGSRNKVGNLYQDGDKLIIEDHPPPMIEQMPFNLVCCFVCALNVFIVGLEADYSCWGLPSCKPGDRMSWYIIDCMMTVAFMIETGLRIAQLGALDYFLGDPATATSSVSYANCSDFFIVFLRFLDTFIFDQAGMDTKIKVLSCFRILQFGRVARMLSSGPHQVSGVRELWLIVSGLSCVVRTVAWVMILLLLIFWAVGIIMVIVVGHSDDFFDYTESDWSKSAYFDTVPRAVFSCFQTMTLSQWSSVIFRPIFQQYPAIIIVVVPFLCLTTVGLLNIIVGVVVEAILFNANAHAEVEAKETAKVHARVMESLRQVFEEADTDGGGTLSKHELLKSTKKPHVKDRLKLLNLPVKDLYQLFDVLDEAGTDEVPTATFFRGCARLRGLALSSDLHRMSVDYSRYIDWTDKLLARTKGTNATLRALVHDMESVDRDVIKAEEDDLDPVLGSRRERSMKNEIAELKASGELHLCPSCGEPLLFNAKFCKHCGHTVPQEKEKGRTATKQSTASKKSGSSLGRRPSLMRKMTQADSFAALKTSKSGPESFASKSQV
jgi:voltage-gated sodium channel